MSGYGSFHAGKRGHKYHARRCSACWQCGQIVAHDNDSLRRIFDRMHERQGETDTNNADDFGCDGIPMVFQSKAEAKVWIRLCRAQERGVIIGLRLQPVYRLKVNGADCGSYRADFSFIVPDGTGLEHRRVIDVKGARTPLYKLKKKLVAAIHGVQVEEWTANSSP